MRACVVLTCALLGACTPLYPEGRFACDRDEDCPPGLSCRALRCHTSAADDAGAVDASADDGGPIDAANDASVEDLPLPAHVPGRCATRAIEDARVAAILGGASTAGRAHGLARISSASVTHDASPRPAQLALAAHRGAGEGMLWVGWIEGAASDARFARVPVEELRRRDATIDLLAITGAGWIDAASDGDAMLALVTHAEPPGAGGVVARVLDTALDPGSARSILAAGGEGGQSARTRISGGRSSFAATGSPPYLVFREDAAGGPLLASLHRDLGADYWSIPTSALLPTPALDMAGGFGPLFVAHDPTLERVVTWDQRRRGGPAPLTTLAEGVLGAPSVTSWSASAGELLVAYPAGRRVTLVPIACDAAACRAAAERGLATAGEVRALALAQVAEGYALATLEDEGGALSVVLRYLDRDLAMLGAPDLVLQSAELDAAERVGDLRLVATRTDAGAAVIAGALLRGAGTDRVWLGGHYACTAR